MQKGLWGRTQPQPGVIGRGPGSGQLIVYF